MAKKSRELVHYEKRWHPTAFRTACGLKLTVKERKQVILTNDETLVTCKKCKEKLK